MGVFIQYCIEHLYCILLCTYISGQTEKVECTDIKAALVTLVPLLVMLLLASFLTLALFMKVCT